ncbi:thioredoxin domain-containing protein 17 isoform X2 [Spodoptera frugiperda]|uniref:Thioredoxin domain-containing protein 17 n=1 Tax=Spodoptera frugiperda TaxID=7108 RepID=A0A2H1VFA7_SPOFR|nr:thioredoxin domain-containing protein 17 isoform X2 [Spodoptera frugiperda]
MVTTLELHGYDEFQKYVANIDPNSRSVVVYFTGEKLPSGLSWCIDCVEAEPVVKAYLNELKKEITFVFVDVGNPETWRNKACPFRTDSRTRLMVIPTIIVWNGVQRLEGSQCAKRELLNMLFEDED